MDIFSDNIKKNAPLADRMRPRTLEAFLGQQHLIGEGKLLRRAIEADKLTSCIFFGQPGSGKSTLAEIIANKTKSNIQLGYYSLYHWLVFCLIQFLFFISFYAQMRIQNLPFTTFSLININFQAKSFIKSFELRKL